MKMQSPDQLSLHHVGATLVWGISYTNNLGVANVLCSTSIDGIKIVYQRDRSLIKSTCGKILFFMLPDSRHLAKSQKKDVEQCENSERASSS